MSKKKKQPKNRSSKGNKDGSVIKKGWIGWMDAQSLGCQRGSSVAAAHKEVEAEKCHSALSDVKQEAPWG